jgi:tRNA (guanine26-N2/guanine27-N2)-dimethyltransferase
MEGQVEVREGATRWIVPEPATSSGPGDSSMPVFYNPVMSINRDMSVSFFRALKRDTIDSIDLLAGTGACGVRLMTEVRSEWDMVLNDVNPLAGDYIRKNLELNGLDAGVTDLPAHRAMAEKRFDHIDIDPFGTPVPFVPHAVNAVRHRGIISVTATDTAVLCGTYLEAAWRRYGIRTAKTPFRHEIGVRSLIAYVVRRFAERDRAAEPVLSFKDEHFYRAFFQVESGSKRADSLLKDINYIGFVPETGERWMQEEPAVGLIGPIWTGPLGRRALIGNMRPVSEKSERILGALSEEVDAQPYHFNTDEFGRALKGRIPKMVDLLRVLRLDGWQASPTHFSPTGFKTDATVSEIEDTLTKRKKL